MQQRVDMKQARGAGLAGAETGRVQVQGCALAQHITSLGAGQPEHAAAVALIGDRGLPAGELGREQAFEVAARLCHDQPAIRPDPDRGGAALTNRAASGAGGPNAAGLPHGHRHGLGLAREGGDLDDAEATPLGNLHPRPGAGRAEIARAVNLMQRRAPRRRRLSHGAAPPPYRQTRARPPSWARLNPSGESSYKRFCPPMPQGRPGSGRARWGGHARRSNRSR